MRYTSTYSRKQIFLRSNPHLTLLGVVLVAGALILTAHTRVSAPPNMHDTNAQETYWSARIQSVGGPAAYAEFAKYVSHLDAGDQHVLAHTFGAALYATSGLGGITVCDSRFSYGCYHEFVGRAIAALGIGVVNQINASCMSIAGSNACQHGIGHGILASLGYAAGDLAKTISLCTKLPGGSFIDGCYAGSFMEYNMRTMIQLSGDERSVGTGGLLAPCTSYTGNPQLSCALLQPQWWGVILPGLEHIQGSPLFARMGELCSEYTGAAVVRKCFEGIGQMAGALADYTPVASRILCDASSHNAGDRLYCRSYDAALFMNLNYGTSSALAVCSDLSSPAKDFCESYALGAANPRHEIALPTL